MLKSIFSTVPIKKIEINKNLKINYIKNKVKKQNFPKIQSSMSNHSHFIPSNPSNGRKSPFSLRQRRPRHVVDNCICLKGRKGAVDGIVKCFCEKDKSIKCEYCTATEHLKCYCESAVAACICENFCSLECICFCHGDLPISVQDNELKIKMIKTILLNDYVFNSVNDSLDVKTIMCSCNSLCDRCDCFCHNEEKKEQTSCACNPTNCADDCKCDCHPLVSGSLCACNPTDCADDCKCDCHPLVSGSLCACNIECPIGCKCSVECKAGIYCLNACLSCCSCKCHNQKEEPVCACSSSCDDKCKCGCHQSWVECEKECNCGCHLQCKNKK